MLLALSAVNELISGEVVSVCLTVWLFNAPRYLVDLI
jgi:hypothetical protein